MAVRVLSGVQPSGKPHIGNYFGAIQNHVRISADPEFEAYFFIADYHALTTVQDADRLREYVRDVAIDYLALGLDTERAMFFRQSDIPEVLELAWMFSCVTGMGLLERAHSYKDKVAKGMRASVGLFSYPLLMAADILAYKPKWVPVGQDQVQHIEMTQDMAQSFNAAFDTEVFLRPEPMLSQTPKVPGLDGEKMSKSYGNTIDLGLSGKKLRKLIMGIKTDSTPVEDPKDPESCSVFALYRLVADGSEQADLAERYRAGGLGYGQAKQELYEKLEVYFAPYRERRAELEQNLDHVESVLARGAERAQRFARATLEEAREACGLR